MTKVFTSLILGVRKNMIVTEWHERFEMTNALQDPIPCHIPNFHALKFLCYLCRLDLTSEFYELKARRRESVIWLRLHGCTMYSVFCTDL
jgi:hypothetical protein